MQRAFLFFPSVTFFMMQFVGNLAKEFMGELLRTFFLGVPFAGNPVNIVNAFKQADF